MQSAVKHFFGEGGGDLGCLERFLGAFWGVTDNGHAGVLHSIHGPLQDRLLGFHSFGEHGTRLLHNLGPA